MQINVIAQKTGEIISSLELSDKFYNRDYNPALVQQVVTAYLANGRQGTRSQKTRAEVKHSTRKPWRQKGTGRARSGMTSSPLWRGGGRAFPSRPCENFAQKVNKKMYRAAMSVILSQLIRDERLVVIDELTVESPRTKEFVAKLERLSVKNGALFVTDQLQEQVHLSSRNLPNTLVIEVNRVDPVSLLKYKKTFLTVNVAKKIEERWS